MKWVLNILGALMILIGAVWTLQGVNVLQGSKMSGHIQYSLLGIVVAVIGVALLVFNNRRHRPLAH